MTVSRFAAKRPVKVASPKEQPLVRSNFAGGLDTASSIEAYAENVSPYLRNVRNVKRGSVGMRKGPGLYSVPAGQAADVSRLSSSGAADVTVTTTQRAATSFIGGAPGRLSRLDLRIKSVSATAPLIVELWSDATGLGTKLATSSIPAASVTGSYQYLSCSFIEAPQVTSATKYWIVCYMQTGGTGSYLWSNSSTYTGGQTSLDSGNTWTTTSGFNFVSYVATTGGTLGGVRVRFSNGNKYDVVAVYEAGGTTGVYRVSTGGALVAIKTGLSASATDYDFFFANDILCYCNGYDTARYWTETADQAVPYADKLQAAPVAVTNHKNRWFFLEKGTSRWVMSNLGDITKYDQNDFGYVGSPKTSDPASSMFVLQDSLWFGTRKTKYTLTGSDISSMTLRRALAGKGIVGQNMVTVDGNFAYFVSDDGVYSCNGTTDDLLSRDITPTITGIPDLTKGELVFWQNTLRFYFAEAGSPVCNAVLSFDTVNGGWFYDTGGYVSRAYAYKTDGDAPLLVECSSVVGAAYYAEQQHSDLGRPITMEYYDIPLAFGDPGVYKQILFWYVRFAGQAGSYQVDCQMDKELQNAPASTLVDVQGSGALWGTAVWGQFKWGANNFIEQTVPVSGEYRWFQPRFVITAANAPVELQGYTLYYLTQQPR